ncbi:hypothetical protein [Gynuella sunshinyii]|nr:hypothetical protein [Gynuella sunshinyii]
MKKTLVTATVLIAAVTGAFLYLFSVEERDSGASVAMIHPDNAQSHDQSSVSENEQMPMDLTLCQSDPVTYDYQYSSHGQYFDQMQDAQSNELVLEASGRVTVSCEPYHSGYQQTWYFSPAQFSQNGQGMFARVARPEVLMQDGLAVLVSLTEAFQIEEFTTGDYDTMSLHLVKDILNWSRFTKGKGMTWQAEEMDINGVSDVRYQVSATRPDVIVRKYRRYPEKAPSMLYHDDQPFVTVSDDSVTEYVFHQQYLQSVNSRYTFIFKDQTKTLSTTQTIFELNKSNQLLAIPDGALAFGKVYTDNLSSDISIERSDRLTQQKALGTDNWNTLQDRLAYMSQDQVADMFLKLRALFRLQPETIGVAGQWLLQHQPDDVSFAPVAMALAQSGNSLAVEALANSATKHDQLNARRYLLGQVGLSIDSTVAVDEILYRLIDQNTGEIPQLAKLALANMSATTKAQQPERYQNNYEYAVADLQKAKSEREIINALHVISNFAAEHNLDLVRPYLESDRPALKMAAYLALRQVPGTAVEEIYMSSLNTSHNETEQLAVAIELGFREVSETSLKSQSEILKTSHSEELRSVLLGNLALAKEKYGWIKPLLASVAEQDPAEAVRLKAKSLL